MTEEQINRLLNECRALIGDTKLDEARIQQLLAEMRALLPTRK